MSLSPTGHRDPPAQAMSDEPGRSPEQALAEGLAERLARWARAGQADHATVALLRRAGRALALAQAEGHVCVPLAALLDNDNDNDNDANVPASFERADVGHPTPWPTATGTQASLWDELAQADPDAGRDVDGATRGTAEPADSPAAIHTLAGLRRCLVASPLVGRGHGPTNVPLGTPLVLDDGDRLYLAKHFDHERRLAARLAQAALAPPNPIDAAAAARLRALFGGDASEARDATAADWPAVAAALALRGRLLVISGGPGTGKTTTMVKLLACLLAAEPGCRIELAAPTGKAASRMTEALRERAAGLPPAVRAALPAEARTVHRLLGVHPGPQRFRHHAGQPLPLDVLVVDEASMLDLALARRLMDAVPPHARIVLLGDKDQLAAVEAGAVFAELSADPSLSEPTQKAVATALAVPTGTLSTPTPAQASPLRDSTVWFSRTHRFGADSGIAQLAADVRSGRSAAALALLRQAAPESDLAWLDDAGVEPSDAAWAMMADGLATYRAALRRDPMDREAVARAWRSFIVLTAVRGGPRGLQAVTRRLERDLRDAIEASGPRPGSGEPAPWYLGRPVIVRHNDPGLRLYNGDVGFVLPDWNGVWQVWFADAAVTDGETPGWRAVPPLRLPPHETALAMTVHQAQGSEFDRVLLLLPGQAGRVLTRELIYTAVTRARQRVTLTGAAPVLAAGIGARTVRHSGLLARLAESLRQA